MCSGLPWVALSAESLSTSGCHLRDFSRNAARSSSTALGALGSKATRDSSSSGRASWETAGRVQISTAAIQTPMFHKWL